MSLLSNEILMVRPNNVYCYNFYPSLAFISLGSKLQLHGYDVQIINSAFKKNYLETIAREVKSRKPLFVGVTMLTSETPDAYKIVKFIKERFDVPIVTGGTHCTLFTEQMADSSYVDYVIAGEGEEYIVEIAKQIKSGGKKSGKICPKRILDIEKLPFPNYGIDGDMEKFINSKLTDKIYEHIKHPARWIAYESSRGCPSRCTFCINTVAGDNLYRKKSAEKVIAEVEEIVKKYRITHVKFIDDNFFVDIKRARKIGQEILDKKLDITWDAECRCDYFNQKMVNDETLKLLKKSGLVEITLGIESGSLRILELMNKRITPEQAEFAVSKCNEHKIIARSSFIIEIPGDSMYDIRQTINFVNKLRKYQYFTCGMTTFRPYPKCELTEKLRDLGTYIEPKTFDEWNSKDVVDMYTNAEHIRPWQVDGKNSEAVCFYINMESSVRLQNFQIDRYADKIINNIFIFLATVRNRIKFYQFTIDKTLYKMFLTAFYARMQSRKSG